MTLTHHPDCGYWPGYGCDCGLTAEARRGMRPWSQAALDEWRKAVSLRHADIDDLPTDVVAC